MSDTASMPSQPGSVIPPDDPQRRLVVAKPDEDGNLRHVGVVGDTYTILIIGGDTGSRYCLIDMHVPRGGGPPPHRHDCTSRLSPGPITGDGRAMRSPASRSTAPRRWNWASASARLR